MRLNDYACQAYAYTEFLHAHHIFLKAKYYGLFFDMGTLTTVCTECHCSIHRRNSAKKIIMNVL
jgi:hypothetical protein